MMNSFFKTTAHIDADSLPNVGSQSRVALPRMYYHGLRPGEELFMPVDPFLQPSSLVEHSQNDVEHGAKVFSRNAYIFVSDTLPRMIYLNLLLRLPAIYFSRVDTIFRDAEVSQRDIQWMVDARGDDSAFMALPTLESHKSSALDSNDAHNSTIYPPGSLSPHTAAGVGLTGHVDAAASVGHAPLPFPEEWTPPVPLAHMCFERSWEAFMDSLLREWKMFNIVSVLLISSIFTMFQIPSAQGDPFTRTAGLLSLVCAVMSTTYGCIYIVKFGTMRDMYRTSKFAEEACKTDTPIWWNVWVLLAMPLVWVSWSMIFFVFSVLSFLLRTGSVLDPNDRPPLSTGTGFGPRIAITGVFGVGIVYLAMIVKTLRSYGTHAVGMGVHVHSGGATHEQWAEDIVISMDRQDGAGRRKEGAHKQEFGDHGSM